jgi:hypothetical protein
VKPLALLMAVREGLVVPVVSTFRVSPGVVGGEGGPPVMLKAVAELGVTVKVSLPLPPVARTFCVLEKLIVVPSRTAAVALKV